MHIVIKRCNVHVKSAQTVVFLAKNRDKKMKCKNLRMDFAPKTQYDRAIKGAWKSAESNPKKHEEPKKYEEKEKTNMKKKSLAAIF